MKVKIDFFTKCFSCLYESPNIQSLTWDNGADDGNSDTYIPRDEHLEIMLNQLHVFNNINCKNCGEDDRLAFAVQRVNDKPYFSGDPSIDVETRDNQLEYQIHNQIQGYSSHGSMIFYMKNGEIKVGEVNGVMTNMVDGSKEYTTKIYLDIDLDIDLFEQSGFGEITDCESIELAGISSVAFFMSFEDMYWREG